MADDRTMERIAGIEWNLDGVQRGVFTSDPQGDWAVCLSPSHAHGNEDLVEEIKKLCALGSRKIHLEDGVCLDFSRDPEEDDMRVRLMLDLSKAEGIMGRAGIDVVPASFLGPVNAINEMMETLKRVWVFAGERRLLEAVETKKQEVPWEALDEPESPKDVCRVSPKLSVASKCDVIAGDCLMCGLPRDGSDKYWCSSCFQKQRGHADGHSL